MLGVVAPVLQVPPLLPERTTLVPAQIAVEPLAVRTEATGRLLLLIVLLQMLVQPPTLVTVTVYVVAVSAKIQLVVAPVLHK